MRPLSMKVPAPVICTSDSKVARGPGLDSALAWTPFAVSAVRRTWPAAVVLAASFPSTPSTGRAFPLNCNANTSSFMRSSPLAGSNPGPAHQEGRWGPSPRVGLSLVLWSSGYAHAAKSALASWRSTVSTLSANQPQIGARTSVPLWRWPRRCHRRPRLMAALDGGEGLVDQTQSLGHVTGLRRDLGQQRQVVGPQYPCARRLPGREAFPHLRPSLPARAGLGHGPAAQEHALRLLLGEAFLGRGGDDRLCQLARSGAVTAVLRELGRPVPRVGQVQGLAKLSGERERLVASRQRFVDRAQEPQGPRRVREAPDDGPLTGVNPIPRGPLAGRADVRRCERALDVPHRGRELAHVVEPPCRRGSRGRTGGRSGRRPGARRHRRRRGARGAHRTPGRTGRGAGCPAGTGDTSRGSLRAVSRGKVGSVGRG